MGNATAKITHQTRDDRFAHLKDTITDYIKCKDRILTGLEDEERIKVQKKNNGSAGGDRRSVERLQMADG